MRHLGFVDGQHVDLLVAMHHMPQAQAGAEFQIALLEGSFQQQDGAAPAQVAHALGLGQVEQGKTVGGTQGIEHALNAVAVGIGFDHRPHTGIAGGGTGTRQVVAQGIQVNSGLNGTGHGAIQQKTRDKTSASATLAVAGKKAANQTRVL